MNHLSREEKREASAIINDLHRNSMIVNSLRIEKMDPAEAARQWGLIKPYLSQIAAQAGTGRTSRRMKYLEILRAMQKIEVKAKGYNAQILEMDSQP